MANALIVTEIDVELAKARAKIDEFVKETEARTIRMGVDAGAPSRTRATLGGQVIEGPDAERVNVPTPLAASRFDAQNEMQRRFFMGGTGFNPPTRPVGTAGLNSVYGDLHNGRSFPPIGGGSSINGGGGDSFLVGNGVAITAGFAAAAAFTNQQVAALQRQKDIQRFDSLQSAADNSFSEQRGVLGLGRAVGGALNDLGRSGAGRVIAGITGLGGLVEFGRQTDGFVDNRSIRDAYDTQRDAQANSRNNEVIREARTTNARTRAIGSEGFGAAAQEVSEQLRETKESLRAEARENGRISNFPAQQAAQDQATAQLADIGVRISHSVRDSLNASLVTSLGGSNNPFASGLASIDASAQAGYSRVERESRGLSATERTSLQQAEQIRSGTERAAFIQNYNRQSFGASASLGSSIDASILARGGFSLNASLESIRGQTETALNNAPGYAAYQRDPNSVGAADRVNIETIKVADLNARAQAQVDYQKNAIQAGTATSANRLAAAFRPLDSQLKEIAGNFLTATAGMRPGSPDFIRAANLADSQAGAVRSSFALQTTQIGIGLATDRASNQAALGRDYVGAQAIGTVGGAINDAVSLMASQRPGLARERLANARGDLNLQAQEFGYTFEAEQFDSFNSYIGAGSRDFQDPQTTFDTFNRQARRLEDVSNSSDADFIGTAAGETGASALGEVSEQLKVVVDILKRRMDDESED